MEKIDFEKALNELEAIVEKMSAQELNLEDALRSFEKGIQLSRSCQQQLKAAEQTVERLVNYEKPQLEPFNEDN